MVGRLVENQEVCLREHQFCQRDASALAAAQSAIRLNTSSPVKERRQRISDDGIIQIGIGVGNLFKQCFFRMKHMMLLIVISDMDLRSEREGTAVRIENAIQNLGWLSFPYRYFR